MGNIQPGRPGNFRGSPFSHYRPQEYDQPPNSYPGYTPTEIQPPGGVSPGIPSTVERHQYQTLPPSYGQEFQNNQNVPAGNVQQVYPQQFWPQGYPPQGYPPQGYMPSDYSPRGYIPQNYPPLGYPQQGYPQQGYPPQGYPIQQSPMSGIGSSPLCATCLACITCLMCSCCQALMGVPMGENTEEDTGGAPITGAGPQVIPPPLSDDS